MTTIALNETYIMDLKAKAVIVWYEDSGELSHKWTFK